MKKAIVITGTPGVGKTTVGALLAERLGAELVELGALVEEEGLHEGLDEETGSLIVDLGALSKRVIELISSKPGKTVVVVGHYAQNVVPRELVSRAFVLRRDPRELRSVLIARGYSGRKLYENLQAEILDICLYEAVEAYGHELVYEVDVSGRGPNEVVEEMAEALEKGLSRVGVVDWLGLLEREGELDHFFSEF